jgi:hypothetical protein
MVTGGFGGGEGNPFQGLGNGPNGALLTLTQAATKDAEQERKRGSLLIPAGDVDPSECVNVDVFVYLCI